MTSNVQTMDSLIANEFAFEIGGEKVRGVFGVRGLVTFACDDDGHRIKPSFQVLKMVQRDPHNLFNTWLRETLELRDSTDRPRRDLAVVAVDDGVETRRWLVKGAWIQKVSYTDFDNSSFEMVAETYTINYDDIEEVFPTSE